MKKILSISLSMKILLIVVIALFGSVIAKSPLNVFAALVPATPEATSVPAMGYVNSIASGNNKLYIAGEFSYFGPNTGNAYPINKTTGAIIDDYPTRFYPSVERTIPDGSNGWYVSGHFGTKGATTAYKLVHLLADGTVDPSFTSSVSANCTIHDMVLAGSVLYVGGAMGGSSCLFALDSATGANTGWDPGPGGVNNAVYAIAVSGNTVYVGGGFSDVGGESRNWGAAFAADTGLLLPWNPDLTNSSIKDIKINGSVVYLGGNFNYTLNANPRRGLVAVDATTGALLNWDPNVTLGGSNEVKDMYFDGTNLYIAGRFDTVGGQARKGLAKFDATDPDDLVLLSWNPGLASGFAAAVDSDGTNLYVGGFFHSAIGGQTRTGLAALDFTTAAATSWNPVTPSDVESIALAGNTVFVGNRGDAGSYGGVQTKSALAEFDPVTQDVTPVITDDNSNFMDIYDMAWDGDILYIGGDFTSVTIGGKTRSRLAAINTDTMQFTDWDPQPDDTIYSVVVKGDRVYVGGEFSTIDGNSIGKLAALQKSTGDVIDTWEPDPTSFATVYSIVTSSDGQTVYAGGEFDTIGGQSRANIAAVDKDTALATSWDPGADDTVYKLLLDDTTMYVGGDFSNIGGQARNYSAALDTAVDTNNALAFNPDTDSTVYAIALNDDTVYLGGDFWEVAAGGHIGVAAVDPVSGALEAWDVSLGSNGFMSNSADNKANDIEAYGGAVFVGGDFHTVATYDPVLYADLEDNTLSNFTSINFQPFFAQFGTFSPVAASTPTVGFALTSSSGNEAVASPTLTVSLSAISASDVTVAYGITGGTATGGGVDYTLASGTATILAGGTSTTIPLVIVDDSTVESDETVAVSLSSPVNATLDANITHTYTILNDDVASGGGGGGGGGNSGGGGNGPIVGLLPNPNNPNNPNKVTPEVPVVPQNPENIQACLDVTPQLNNAYIKFNKNLEFKQNDLDVKALQVFLNRNGFIIAKKGEGSLGNESTYFGPSTRNELKRFQTVYQKLIEAYFQPINEMGVLDKPTRDFINSIVTWGQDVCQRTTPPLPPPILPPVLLPLPPETEPVTYPSVVPPVVTPVIPQTPSVPSGGSTVPENPPVVEPVSTTTPVEIPPVTPPTEEVTTTESSGSSGGGVIDFLTEGPIGSIVSAVLNFGGGPVSYIEENFPGVEKVIKEVNQVSAYVVAPVATAVLYSVPIQENLIRVTAAKDIWLMLIQAFNSLLAFLGLRRTRRYWGTVYDSKSKQPIDPAIVQLIDAQTGQVVEEAVTDMAGRYGFLTRSGKFLIRAEKTNYAFPAKNVTGKNDEIFDNLYYGEEFSMSEISNLIVPNIPMDPVNFDWNQMDKKRIIKTHPHLQYALSLFVKVLYSLGFVVSIFMYMRDTSLINLVTIGIYIVIFALSVMLSYLRLWGAVYIANGDPAAGYIVELLSPKFDTVVMGKAKTAQDGKFFLKALRGQYTLKVKKVDPVSQQLIEVDSRPVTAGKAEVFNEDVYIG